MVGWREGGSEERGQEGRKEGGRVNGLFHFYKEATLPIDDNHPETDKNEQNSLGQTLVYGKYPEI